MICSARDLPDAFQVEAHEGRISSEAADAVARFLLGLIDDVDVVETEAMIDQAGQNPKGQA